MNSSKNKLLNFYETLLNHYGPQHWWPADDAFEVMVGAVLTQNTNWNNVEKAIANLKTAGKIAPQEIDRLSHEELARLIRPAGYFNIKARRLKNLVHWFIEKYQGKIENLAQGSIDGLREELLALNGIGPETADSIILYALEKPTFVVDTYTFRLLVRHGCIDSDCGYDEIKYFCENNLPQDLSLYNELHALIVRVGKQFCKPKPRCPDCPLEKFEHYLEED